MSYVSCAIFTFLSFSSLIFLGVPVRFIQLDVMDVRAPIYPTNIAGFLL